MSGFDDKPSLGWNHSNEQITKGVVYKATYIGCIEVRFSMKKLNFKQRSNVAKECIDRVCQYAKLITAKQPKKHDAKVLLVVNEVPNLQSTGTNVNMNISSGKLTLLTLDGRSIITSHEIARISFASLGNKDTVDFMGYIAKDVGDLRVCYIVKCSNDTSKDVLSAIGHAFEMRFQQFTKKIPIISTDNPNYSNHDYYNDLPGKVPPDIPPLTPNLIDFHADGICQPIHDYVNDCVARERDVFDLLPLTPTLSKNPECSLTELENEAWFHGHINRLEAERLLQENGDFLVREQPYITRRQFVLSGMHDNNKIHLLLIDPDGAIRTKDKLFSSVSALVEFHYKNVLPITYADSVLVLRHKVFRGLV